VVSFSNDRRLKGSGSISSGMSSPWSHCNVLLTHLDPVWERGWKQVS
jgi:hypothetical protein